MGTSWTTDTRCHFRTMNKMIQETRENARRIKCGQMNNKDTFYSHPAVLQFRCISLTLFGNFPCELQMKAVHFLFGCCFEAVICSHQIKFMLSLVAVQGTALLGRGQFQSWNSSPALFCKTERSYCQVLRLDSQKTVSRIQQIMTQN